MKQIKADFTGPLEQDPFADVILKLRIPKAALPGIIKCVKHKVQFSLDNIAVGAVTLSLNGQPAEITGWAGAVSVRRSVRRTETGLLSHPTSGTTAPNPP